MKINKLNYENFVIDYIEGQLDKVTKLDFDQFLDKHPEVFEEIKDYMAAPVLTEDENIVFKDKSALKKPNRNWIYAGVLVLLIGLGLGSIFLGFNEQGKNQPVDVNSFVPMANMDKNEIEEIKTTKITPLKDTEKETSEPNIEIANTKIIEKKSLPKIESRSVVKSPIFEEASADTPINFIAENITNSTTNEIVQSGLDIPLRNSIELIAQIESKNDLETFRQSTEKENITIALSDFAKDYDKIAALQRKSDFIDLFKPEAFNDLDLKEAFAIESRIEKTTNDNLLNTLLPSSLTK